eukprot:6474394-Amphidinium_carterae.2
MKGMGGYTNDPNICLQIGVEEKPDGIGNCVRAARSQLLRLLLRICQSLFGGGRGFRSQSLGMDSGCAA